MKKEKMNGREWEVLPRACPLLYKQVPKYCNKRSIKIHKLQNVKLEEKNT